MVSPQFSTSERASSWLSIIAEAAGVGRSDIASVEISSKALGPVWITAQLRSPEGRVLGATGWSGSGEELEERVRLDFGFCWEDVADHEGGAELVVFFDESHGAVAPEDQVADAIASRTRFRPGSTARLRLDRATRPPLRRQPRRSVGLSKAA